MEGIDVWTGKIKYHYEIYNRLQYRNGQNMVFIVTYFYTDIGKIFHSEASIIYTSGSVYGQTALQNVSCGWMADGPGLLAIYKAFNLGMMTKLCSQSRAPNEAVNQMLTVISYL